MTQVAKFTGDVLIQGTCTPTTLTVPAGTITDAAIAAAAGIAATKLDHQHAIRYSQADGTDVASAIVPVHICRAAATLVDVEVVCVDAPSGGDKQFTVDVKVADEATPTPASVLGTSGVVTYSASDADCEVKSGTIASPTLADGDTLIVEVTASGSTGTQGQGLVVVLTIREDAD